MEKSDLKLKLTGKLEIQYDGNNANIKAIDITAKNIDQLIHKLLDETIKINLGKLNELLQFKSVMTRIFKN